FQPTTPATIKTAAPASAIHNHFGNGFLPAEEEDFTTVGFGVSADAGLGTGVGVGGRSSGSSSSDCDWETGGEERGVFGIGAMAMSY
ncbi:MAG: hypothetical protein AAB619_01300, partial [Patescibacteria group bacterium]